MADALITTSETLEMCETLQGIEVGENKQHKGNSTGVKKRRRVRSKHQLRHEVSDPNNTPEMLFSLNTISNEVGSSLARMNLDTDADFDGGLLLNQEMSIGSIVDGSQETYVHQQVKLKPPQKNHPPPRSNLSPLVLTEDYQESFQSQHNDSSVRFQKTTNMWQHYNSPYSQQGPSSPSTSSHKAKEVRSHRKNVSHIPDCKIIQKTSLCQHTSTTGTSASSTPKKQKKKRSQAKNTPKTQQSSESFNEYWSEEEVVIGLQKQELIEGVMRINPKNYTEAYITAPDKGQDILIEGLKNRNRSLEGDEVIIEIHPSSEWKNSENSVQRTGSVVFIRNQVHPRKAVGFLKPMADKNPNVALLSPRDPRVPRLRVPMTSCPDDFFNDHKKYATKLFLAMITEWKDVKFAMGLILEEVGDMGDIKAESSAILLENDLKVEPFSVEMLAFIPQTPYKIPEDELLKREDLRQECIFTIDPATARDLDDAMSCKELPNGNLEIGVHISDVSFFIEEGTKFDKEIAERATSTYLVDTVYHMLPRDLCMLCSLLPGVDKLAYSVFWEVDLSGNIISHRFTRSVINSCAQLAYEHAQIMLENPQKAWTVDEVPPVHGNFSVHDLSRVVNQLNRIALILRKKRFSDGALRIDQPKLVFSLDRATGLPLSYSVYVNKESHRLIEEFMLLANMTVAEAIYKRFPSLAFLRSHLPPLEFLMDQLQKMMEKFGVHLDISSAGALQKSLRNYDGQDFLSEARMMVLHARCAKPMARAKYFCSNGVSETDFWHYALNVPLYTHFTSPIRRYADVMVHRLLSSTLGYQDPPKWEPMEVHKIAANCNKKKYSAKLAGEKSSDLYLAMLIGQEGPMLEMAVTVDVKDRSFDVIVCDLGITQRIYTNNLEAEVHHKTQDNISSLEIKWLPTALFPCSMTQTIEMFSIVTVQITKAENVLKLESTLVRPSVNGMPLR